MTGDELMTCDFESIMDDDDLGCSLIIQREHKEVWVVMMALDVNGYRGKDFTFGSSERSLKD